MVDLAYLKLCEEMTSLNHLLIYLSHDPRLLLVVLEFIKKQARLDEEIVGDNVSVVTVLQYFVVDLFFKLGEIKLQSIELFIVIFLFLA